MLPQATRPSLHLDSSPVISTPKFSCRAINQRARGACSINSRPVCCNATLGRRHVEAWSEAPQRAAYWEVISE